MRWDPTPRTRRSRAGVSPMAGGTRPPVRRPLVDLLATLVLLALAAGCGSGADATLEPDSPSTATSAAAPLVTAATADVGDPSVPTTSPVVPTGAPGGRRVSGVCPAPPTASEPLPPATADALAAVLDDPRLLRARYGISVWVDGYGEVVGRDGDVPLIPASNQKLWTVAGLQQLLPPDFAFTTELRIAGTRRDAAVEGDLVVVAGGDTTLTRDGAHSLASLAAAVRLRGITSITGRVLVDETHYATDRLAPGWEPAQFAYIGPQSAFVVDWNGTRKDPAYLGDPARGNGETFLAELAEVGITVGGGVAVGASPLGTEPLVTVRSEPLPQLIERMLGESDNMLAESLVREVGRRTGAATTEAGTVAITRAVTEHLCVPATGINADGSGISRADRQTATTLRQLLQAVAAAPGGETFRAGLAEAGRTGTLRRRLTGPTTAGRVWAKTGTLAGTRALAGYARTTSGREVVFAVLANGEDAEVANATLDDLVTGVLAALG